MKIRNGFVSNSSSSSFIVDIRKPEVQDLLSKLDKGETSYQGLGRYTAVFDSDDFKEFDLDYYDSMWPLRLLPPEVYKLIGGFDKDSLRDNFAYVRQSDEGMGGYLCSDESFDVEKELSKICEWKGEYH